MTKSKLIDIYYDLFDYLDEVDMFAEAIKTLCKCNLRKSVIRVSLEELRLHHIENELITINTLSKEELNTFNNTYSEKRGKARCMYKAGKDIKKIVVSTGITTDDLKKMIKDENLKQEKSGIYQTTIGDYE